MRSSSDDGLSAPSELEVADTHLFDGASSVADIAEEQSPASDPRASVAQAVCQPGAFVRQYQLIRELGRGGMGTVFLARDTKLGRLVAIKFVTRYDSAAAQRFIAEARATARCNHENIVTIHEVDEHRGLPYMVLEYLPGKTLQQWLSEQERAKAGAEGGERGRFKRKPIATGRIIELLIPVVRALKSAHEMGIVHRDLKPANIALTDAGTIKVLDFGLAKLQAEVRRPSLAVITGPDGKAAPAPEHEPSNLTRTGAFMGTLTYMSPEQWAAAQADHRSDIWAVGIMLFEMVAGGHPLTPLSAEKLRTVAELDQPMPRASDLEHAGPLGPIIDRCLIKRRQDRMASAEELLRELQSVQTELRRASTTGHGAAANPFIGLAAFQGGDADSFFGRTRDIEYVVGRLRAHPLVALVAPSGTGKSSLVRAGVVPALKRSGEGWDSLVIRPGRKPLSVLAEELLAFTGAQADSISTGRDSVRPGEATSEHNPVTAGAALAALVDRAMDVAAVRDKLLDEPGFLGTALRQRATRKLRRLVLFVDQFEELYTLCRDPAERAAFASCLEGVADDASSPLRVIIALRADFLDRLARDREFMGAVTRGLVILPPIGREGLREALTQPVLSAGFRFESEVMVADMLDTLDSTRGALPLLQFTAARLWDLRDREQRVIPEARYREIGGIEGTLASHADAVLAAMTNREQVLARRVLERLVTAERTRALVAIDELCEEANATTDESTDTSTDASTDISTDISTDASTDTGDIIRVIERLASARLLLIERRESSERSSARAGTVEDSVGGEAGEARGGNTVELVHESLIDRWPTLRRWLDENADDVAFRHRLRAAAKQWLASGRASGALWRDETVREARRFHERYRGELSTGERSYLAAVFSFAERASVRRRRAIVAMLCALAAIAAIMAYLAWRETSASERATRASARAQEAAERARVEAERAGVEASRARDASRMAVARQLADDPTSALALLREVVERERMHGWEQEVRAALDGGVASEVIARGGALVLAVAHAPRGWVLIDMLRDHSDTRIRAADGLDIAVPATAGMSRLVLSPAFDQLVTIDLDGSVYLFDLDLATGEVNNPRAISGHSDLVWGARFSPDGTRLVTYSKDRSARVTTVDGSAPPVALLGHEGSVVNGNFTADGQRVVTVSFDHTARIWSLAPPGGGSGGDSAGEPGNLAPSVVLRGHTDRINNFVFSPDGTRIATASFDHTARIWSLNEERPPVVLRGHGDWVMNIDFSPDGRRVATASYDQSARIWTLDDNGELAGSVALEGHKGWVIRVHFSPDGRYVATASVDRTARIWPVFGHGPAQVLRHGGAVQNAVFRADSRQVATYADDGALRVWSLDDRLDRPAQLLARDSLHGEFSRDGATLVAVADKGTVQLWDPRRLELLRTLYPDGRTTSMASISPDGRLVAVAHDRGEVTILSVSGERPARVVGGHRDEVTCVQFSPDGNRIVTASKDHTARIITLADGRATAVIDGHTEWVNWAEFSPDGTMVATASHDKTVRLVRVSDGAVLSVLAGHTQRVFKLGFSPDGRRLASASADATVRVWSLSEDGRPLGEPVVLTGHRGSVISVQFSPDGRRVITGSTDRTARIIDLAGDQAPIVLPFSDQVEFAAFSPDGSQIVTAGYTHGVQLRPTPPAQLDDEFLWSVSNYCMPATIRKTLLSMDEASIEQDVASCRRRTRARR